MPESEGGFKEFRLGDLFDIKKGKRLTKSDMIPGKIRFIGATESNNGVTACISNNKHLHPAETITVTYNGSVGNAFYQPQPFWASDDVNVFYPKYDLNENSALYLLTTIRKKGGKYGYSFKWTKERMETDLVILPVDKVGNINWSLIELFIKKIKENCEKELDKFFDANGYSDCTLTNEEQQALTDLAMGNVQMQRMKIVDAFNVANTHNILKSDVVFGSGTVPYVTASESDNSVTSHISYNDDLKESGNTIMIGGKTLVITYQPKDFFSNDSHNLKLTIYDERGKNESAQLFMVAALYKSLKPIYSWGNSISKAKIQKDYVDLPVTPEGTIDYAFMETYVNALKKQCVARLKASDVFQRNKELLKGSHELKPYPLSAISVSEEPSMMVAEEQSKE